MFVVAALLRGAESLPVPAVALENVSFDATLASAAAGSFGTVWLMITEFAGSSCLAQAETVPSAVAISTVARTVFSIVTLSAVSAEILSQKRGRAVLADTREGDAAFRTTLHVAFRVPTPSARDKYAGSAVMPLDRDLCRRIRGRYSDRNRGGSQSTSTNVGERVDA